MTAKDTATEIVRRLNERGYRALLAGGCVRDMLLGLEPQDYDIACDADPDEVIGIFQNAHKVGAQFGVVVVRLKDNVHEVARFRRDIGYSDGRRPDRVVFTDEKEDAQRRDFTVNGMFWDPSNDRVLDYVGGQKDLERRIIRTIGSAHDRFLEDHLRMMRAIRFACRLGWDLDEAVKTAIEGNSSKIQTVSSERIRNELVKILTEGGAAQGVRWLLDTGLMHWIIPELTSLEGVPQPPAFHPEGDVLLHTLIMLGLMRLPPPELAMGVLLHDVGKPCTIEFADRIRFNNHTRVGADMTTGICARLRFSSEQTTHINRLVSEHHQFMHVKQMRPSRLKRFLRMDRFSDHLELHRLDCLSSHGDLENYEFCRTALDGLEPEEIRPRLLVSGADLISLGYTPGPAFKVVLRRLEDAQLDSLILHKDHAIELARTYFSEMGVLSSN